MRKFTYALNAIERRRTTFVPANVSAHDIDINDTMKRRVRLFGAGVAAINLTTSGCANAPSINVLGAYFPEWMFSIVAGVLLTILAYAVLARTRARTWLQPGAIVYPAAATLFALLFWLVAFGR